MIYPCLAVPYDIGLENLETETEYCAHNYVFNMEWLFVWPQTLMASSFAHAMEQRIYKCERKQREERNDQKQIRKKQKQLLKNHCK